MARFVAIGLGEWQSEGFDRPNMDLPGQQDALVEQVAAANARTIVVLGTCSPISMPWIEKVAAVVQAWYPGQECGNAIADVLFGDTNPCGKLPQTFPAHLEETLLLQNSRPLRLTFASVTWFVALVRASA